MINEKINLTLGECFFRNFQKRGMVGEGMLTIYRLILVFFIALIIIGLSAAFYDHYIDVRDVEARILARQVVDCLSPNGEFNFTNFIGHEKDILNFCEIKNVERFYVNVSVFSLGKLNSTFEQGDSGATWINEISNQESFRKYKAGNYNFSYPVVFVYGNSRSEGEIKLEIFVGHEF